MRRSFVLAVLTAACTAAPEAGPAETGNLACTGSEESAEARGVLAYANDTKVSAEELLAIGVEPQVADDIVAARPFDTLASLAAVPSVRSACGVLIAQACDVRGLCEAALPLWSWNLKTFPLSGSTIDRVAETLATAEIAGFQEVDSLYSFDQLVGKLPGWIGIAGEYGFGTHVAIAFRADRLHMIASESLWSDDWEHFPRPVLAITLEITGRAGSSRFTIADVHLKAQIDADSQRRRREAIAILEPWLAAKRAAGERVIVLGDWNDDIDDPPDSNVFLPLLDKPDAYVTPTLDVAQRGGYSYIPFKRLIDHVILTRETTETLQVADVAPLALDLSISDYVHTVSDHRPVRATLIPVLPTL